MGGVVRGRGRGRGVFTLVSERRWVGLLLACTTSRSPLHFLLKLLLVILQNAIRIHYVPFQATPKSILIYTLVLMITPLYNTY